MKKLTKGSTKARSSKGDLMYETIGEKGSKSLAKALPINFGKI
jgi:hypothetical protein